MEYNYIVSEIFTDKNLREVAERGSVKFHFQFFINLPFKFLENTLCLDTRQPGSVFKMLDTRQSEILFEFSRNILFNSYENSRYLFRNLKRFQILFWV